MTSRLCAQTTHVQLPKLSCGVRSRTLSTMLSYVKIDLGVSVLWEVKICHFLCLTLWLINRLGLPSNLLHAITIGLHDCLHSSSVPPLIPWITRRFHVCCVVVLLNPFCSVLFSRISETYSPFPKCDRIPLVLYVEKNSRTVSVPPPLLERCWRHSVFQW